MPLQTSPARRPPPASTDAVSTAVSCGNDRCDRRPGRPQAQAAGTAADWTAAPCGSDRLRGARVCLAGRRRSDRLPPFGKARRHALRRRRCGRSAGARPQPPPSPLPRVASAGWERDARGGRGTGVLRQDDAEGPRRHGRRSSRNPVVADRSPPPAVSPMPRKHGCVPHSPALVGLPPLPRLPRRRGLPRPPRGLIAVPCPRPFVSLPPRPRVPSSSCLLVHLSLRLLVPSSPRTSCPIPSRPRTATPSPHPGEQDGQRARPHSIFGQPNTTLRPARYR